MSTPSGRWARTHDRLLECALDLFERQGFEETTVAQIAAAAAVTEMTFFRHYPSKDRLLLEDPYDPVIAASVAAQPRRLDPLGRAVAGLRAAWAQMADMEARTVRRRIRIAATVPSLRAGVMANNAETEQLVAAELVNGGADPLNARVAAAAVLAGVTAALLEWSLHDDLSLDEAITAALDTLEGHRG